MNTFALMYIDILNQQISLVQVGELNDLIQNENLINDIQVYKDGDDDFNFKVEDYIVEKEQLYDYSELNFCYLLFKI